MSNNRIRETLGLEAEYLHTSSEQQPIRETLGLEEKVSNNHIRETLGLDDYM